jgi:hypothetical protein
VILSKQVHLEKGGGILSDQKSSFPNDIFSQEFTIPAWGGAAHTAVAGNMPRLLWKS